MWGPDLFKGRDQWRLKFHFEINKISRQKMHGNSHAPEFTWAAHMFHHEKVTIMYFTHQVVKLLLDKWVGLDFTYFSSLF